MIFDFFDDFRLLRIFDFCSRLGGSSPARASIGRVPCLPPARPRPVTGDQHRPFDYAISAEKWSKAVEPGIPQCGVFVTFSYPLRSGDPRPRGLVTACGCRPKCPGAQGPGYTLNGGVGISGAAEGERGVFRSVESPIRRKKLHRSKIRLVTFVPRRGET